MLFVSFLQNLQVAGALLYLRGLSLHEFGQHQALITHAGVLVHYLCSPELLIDFAFKHQIRDEDTQRYHQFFEHSSDYHQLSLRTGVAELELLKRVEQKNDIGHVFEGFDHVEVLGLLAVAEEELVD